MQIVGLRIVFKESSIGNINYLYKRNFYDFIKLFMR